MNPAAAPRPIEKNVVLVGAGNAHLVFVKKFAMRPLPGVAVTLVSEFGEIPYSAMTTGHIVGDYTRDEITIDLVRLCATAGVRLVPQRVERIDTGWRRVHFADRPPLSYDALSIGIGSLPACPPELQDADHSLFIRPMGPFLRKLTELENTLRASPRPFHFVVVGGGASGCELTLAIHRRLGTLPGFRMTLLQANELLLPGFPPTAAATFQRVYAELGISVRCQARVTSGDAESLTLAGGERIAYDAVLWATNAAPLPLLRTAGLAVNAGGFLEVRDTLQSVKDTAVFGTGDCVAFVDHPELPRNGVMAVREGAVLFENIAAFLREQPLQPFVPQRYFLTLLNTADSRAVFSYGALALRGRWVRRLKDWIDRRWMAKYVRPMPAPAEQPAEESYLMRCGGCGSKISSDVLSAVLKRLDLPDDSRILLGCRAGEDAAVHRFRPELYGDDPGHVVEVQTVDFFKAFINDPYIFGQVAALHSLSDLYAMNARPFSALAIATLPYARGPVQEAQLFELLSGAVDVFKRLGVVLTGGHTTEGNEMALGFSVTGHADERRIFQKGKLSPGDKLILTKPLGSGALLAAWMRGACKSAWLSPLLASLLQPNAAASAIFARHGVSACTDITGFGLAGHLLEMLDPSRTSARLERDHVPVHAGFTEVVAAGIVSTLQRDNAKIACRVEGIAAPAWLFDPQTSGGLLAGVKPDVVATVLDELRAAGYAAAGVIGDVEPLSGDAPPVIQLVASTAKAESNLPY